MFLKGVLDCAGVRKDMFDVLNVLALEDEYSNKELYISIAILGEREGLNPIDPFSSDSL